MINTFAIPFIEKASGQKLAALLADKVDVSERTLRSESFSNKTVEKVRIGLRDAYKADLKRSGYDEIGKRIFNHPKSLYAGIIYDYQVNRLSAAEFKHAIGLAKKIDDVSAVLCDARQKGDIEEFKDALLSSEFGSEAYFRSMGNGSLKEIKLSSLQSFKAAKDWKDIDEPLNAIKYNCLLSLMALWDIELYSLYGSKYEPRSLFSLLLPKVDPLAKYISDQEIEKKRGMFWLPTKRLIDLVSCFGWRSKYRDFPDEIPKVSDGAFWGDETEQNLVNWRDGTKRFLHRDFIHLWGINGKDLLLLNPLYVAAKMWEIAFVKINGQTKSILVVEADYMFWWEKHYRDLTNDLNLSNDGKDHWPKCFEMI
jgi:hypothetical protein